MVERRDDARPRIQAVPDPPFVVFALAPVTGGNAGPNANPHGREVPWIDRQGAITRCRGFSQPLSSQKESRTTNPRICIFRIKRRLFIDRKLGSALAYRANRGSAIVPDGFVFRH